MTTFADLYAEIETEARVTGQLADLEGARAHYARLARTIVDPRCAGCGQHTYCRTHPVVSETGAADGYVCDACWSL